MAKDNRSRQVALKTERSATANPKKKKKKNSPVKLVIKILLAVFLVMLLVFLFVVGRYLYSYFVTDDGSNIKVPVEYDTTAEEDVAKVSYYLVGLMGESSTDPLEMVSLVCFDKKAGTVDVLQMPVSSYLGKTEGWSVTTLAAAWSDPRPLTWCEKCRQRVFEPEVGEGNTHTVCGETLTEKKGSATENMIDMCNDQYSMPVDAFFILPQKALVKLVDAVGGVDVKLDAEIKVNDVRYKKGVQTLSGEAALYYAVSADYKSTPATDITRMQHQRQVFTALFVRMAAMSEEELHDEVIDPVMSSSTPIRVTETTRGLKAMLSGISSKSADAVDYEEAMTILIQEMGKRELTDMQYHILPGEVAKVSSQNVYSVHKAELLTLLTEQFNPYGQPIAETDLGITEVKNSGKADVKTATFDTVVAPQEGVIQKESEDPGE